MKKQNLGFLTVGLVVGLLIGGIYSQKSAIAANIQGHGRLVNGWGTRLQSNTLWIFRMWEDGTIEKRLITNDTGSFGSKWFPIREPA